MPDEKLPDDVLWHQSGVNPTGEPFIQLIRGNEIVAQMSPEQARDHAITILEAAEASEQDAFIVDWARNKLGVSLHQAGALLMDLRTYRAERTNKKGGPTRRSDWVMPKEKS